MLATYLDVFQINGVIHFSILLGSSKSLAYAGIVSEAGRHKQALISRSPVAPNPLAPHRVPPSHFRTTPRDQAKHACAVQLAPRPGSCSPMKMTRRSTSRSHEPYRI